MHKLPMNHCEISRRLWENHFDTAGFQRPALLGEEKTSYRMIKEAVQRGRRRVETGGVPEVR
jgi:hypothetical protein